MKRKANEEHRVKKKRRVDKTEAITSHLVEECRRVQNEKDSISMLYRLLEWADTSREDLEAETSPNHEWLMLSNREENEPSASWICIYHLPSWPEDTKHPVHCARIRNPDCQVHWDLTAPATCRIRILIRILDLDSNGWSADDAECLATVKARLPHKTPWSMLDDTEESEDHFLEQVDVYPLDWILVLEPILVSAGVRGIIAEYYGTIESRCECSELDLTTIRHHIRRLARL